MEWRIFVPHQRNIHRNAITPSNDAHQEIEHASHDPIRKRKLLLNRDELNKLLGKTTERGLTIVSSSILPPPEAA